MENESQDGYVAPRRLSFPGDEQSFPWLPLLLDAYLAVDKGVAGDILAVQAAGQRVACARGCFVCCAVQKTIPVYPLELVGITWYAVEKILGPAREKLKMSLRSHGEGSSCPFLIDTLCVIHPMRPLACRQFIVLGRTCEEGEDPYRTRKGEVMVPGSSYIEEAFFTMLPFYGVTDEFERNEAIQGGLIHRMVSVLHSGNWQSLAERMDAFDAHRHSPGG